MTSSTVALRARAFAARVAANPRMRRTARLAAPSMVFALMMLVMAAPAFAQTVGEPSTTPIDTIVTKVRNFLITVLMPLIGAIAIVWGAFLLYQGGREGMGNMIKVVGATLAAFGAVGLIELLKAFAEGRAR